MSGELPKAVGLHRAIGTPAYLPRDELVDPNGRMQPLYLNLDDAPVIEGGELS